MKVWAISALNLIGHSGEHSDTNCVPAFYTNKQVSVCCYVLFCFLNIALFRTVWAVATAMPQKTSFSKTAEHPDVQIVMVRPTLIEWLSISLLIGLSTAAIKHQAI